MNAQPNQQGWRGANRDGVYPGDGMLQNGLRRIDRALSADNAGKGYSSPVVANNHIYNKFHEAGDKVFSAFTMDGKTSVSSRIWKQLKYFV
ncbi:hypothetical protein MASR1M31_15150 [Porphyromonadaceae bacterium]